jgi:hypothetical protein
MRWQRETGESSERITTLPSRVSDSSDIAGGDHAAYHRVKPKMLFQTVGTYTLLCYLINLNCHVLHDCSSTSFWSGCPNSVLVLLNLTFISPCIIIEFK